MPWYVDITARVGAMLIFLILTVLALVWLERKFAGRIQMRLGPMRTGYQGLLQSLADAVKLLLKEDLRPANADRWAFQMAPFVVFVPIFLIFVTIPFSRELVIRNLDMGLFYIIAVSGLSIVGIVMAGWGSDNKYALLGAVRSAAQMISYELPLVLALLGIAMQASSLNLVTIVEQQRFLPNLFMQPLGFTLFMVAALAELHRSPFDIPVAESEVVGGPFIEYSGIRWGIFYLSEYVNLVAVAALASLVFLGGWEWPLLPPAAWFLVKTFALIMVIMWVRATLPRLRIDQLMDFAWKILLPLAFVNIFIVGLYRLYQWPTWTVSLISLAMAIVAAATVYHFPGGERR
ncbi:MAG: NADH-quinone oxidoreductase subunit NuoH [Chloroflexi bacterium]|nr:NADH-quinone oxidoreductase subunit NuoH [Chloroflexota bacterium]